MALVLLAVLYLALTAALPLAVRAVGRRPSWWSAAALALLPLAFTASGFLPGRSLSPTGMLGGVAPWVEPWRLDRMAGEPDPNPLLLDPLSQFLPWRRAARDDLLFDPSQGGGAALLANGQSAVLYPTEVLARRLVPFRAVTFSQAARLLLAVWGMFLLARALALSETASLVGAAVFLGSGFLQVWRLHPHSLVAATAPWVLLALVELVRRPGRWPAVVLAVSGAVAVAGGHPETLLHVVLFGLLLVAALLAVGVPGEPAPDGLGRGRRTARVALWGGAGAALSLLLAAPLLLPFVDNLVVAGEWVHRRGAGTVVEVPLAESLVRLRPSLAVQSLGDPFRGTWSGPENLAELGGGSLGAAALLLALLAPAAGRRGRQRKLALALLALGVVGLAVSVHLPWLSRPFGAVPLLRESLLKRLSLWWVLGGALLAGIGLDAWRAAGEGEGGGVRRMRWAVAGSAAAVALLLAWAAGPPSVGRPELLWGEWGVLVVATLALLPVGRGRAGRAAAVLLFAAVLVPRVGCFAHWVPPVSSLSFYPETLGVSFVGERLDELPPSGWRVAGLDAALVPQSAAFFGFEEVRAYDPMTFAPYLDFAALFGEPVTVGWNRVLDPATPALAFLGTRFVFEHPSMGARQGVEVVYAGADALIYENPRALPRLFVPRGVIATAGPADALAEAGRITDFAARVAASGEGLAALGGGRPAGTIANGDATVSELVVDGRRVTARVVAAAPALLASSQPAIPGWRAQVDGVAVEPVRVNGAFLGLVLPPGDHRVALTYAPRSWTLGLWLFAVGALLTAALLHRGWRPGRPVGG